MATLACKSTKQSLCMRSMYSIEPPPVSFSQLLTIEPPVRQSVAYHRTPCPSVSCSPLNPLSVSQLLTIEPSVRQSVAYH